MNFQKNEEDEEENDDELENYDNVDENDEADELEDGQRKPRMYEKSVLPSTRKERKQSFGKRLQSESVTSQIAPGERRFGSMAVSFLPGSAVPE